MLARIINSQSVANARALSGPLNFHYRGGRTQSAFGRWICNRLDTCRKAAESGLCRCHGAHSTLCGRRLWICTVCVCLQTEIWMRFASSLGIMIRVCNLISGAIEIPASPLCLENSIMLWIENCERAHTYTLTRSLCFAKSSFCCFFGIRFLFGTWGNSETKLFCIVL